MFMYEFNRKLDEYNCKAAVTWAMDILNNSGMQYSALKQTLCARYKKLVEEYSNKNQMKIGMTSTIQVLINAIEELSPGKGALCYAKLCMDHCDYQGAYDCYLLIFTNPLCTTQMKESAGFELANLIFNGMVPLNNESEHDSELDVIQKRSEKARQFIEGNFTPFAVRLNQYFDRIHSGNLQLQGSKTSFSLSGMSIFAKSGCKQVQNNSDFTFDQEALKTHNMELPVVFFGV
jgi:hypothetical protein